jgi:hypothetical protein
MLVRLPYGKDELEIGLPETCPVWCVVYVSSGGLSDEQIRAVMLILYRAQAHDGASPSSQ